LKTAGTTWLEELVGLSLAGGDGLLLAKEIYAEAYHRREELCKPYEFVVKIDHGKLPSPLTVQKWSSVEFASALRHEQTQPAYNPHLRQLLHVGYKLAAEKISRYMNLLDSCRKIIGESVTDNLFRRHISPVFIGK
jgi:hypothetical protein